MIANTHELIMMAITAVVFLAIGFVAGKITQRFLDVKEFGHEGELSSPETGYPETAGQRAA